MANRWRRGRGQTPRPRCRSARRWPAPARGPAHTRQTRCRCGSGNRAVPPGRSRYPDPVAGGGCPWQSRRASTAATAPGRTANSSRALASTASSPCRSTRAMINSAASGRTSPAPGAGRHGTCAAGRQTRSVPARAESGAGEHRLVTPTCPRSRVMSLPMPPPPGWPASGGRSQHPPPGCCRCITPPPTGWASARPAGTFGAGVQGGAGVTQAGDARLGQASGRRYAPPGGDVGAHRRGCDR